MPINTRIAIDELRPRLMTDSRFMRVLALISAVDKDNYNITNELAALEVKMAPTIATRPWTFASQLDPASGTAR